MTLMPCHHLLPSQWGQLMMMRGQDQEALLQVRLSAWEACGKGAQFLVTDVELGQEGGGVLTEASVATMP
jgi:hypothetical protein